MNKKYNFAFIILNYNTFKFTCDCVKSIYNKCMSRNFKIIIVDNFSPDNSGIELQKKFANDKNIDVILNKNNFGFSIGNNIGIKYASKRYNPDFIIVNNSDTLLITNDFLDRIEKIYKEYEFAVLGPKVHIMNNKLQYLPTKIQTKKQIGKAILKYYLKYLLNFIYLEVIDRYFFSQSSFLDDKDARANRIYTDVLIHGCFFVFSKKYLEHYEGIPEKTTFYREEDFIYINCKKKQLLTLYHPSLEIFHCINGSIQSSHKDKRKRNLFRYKKHIISSKILYKEF